MKKLVIVLFASLCTLSYSSAQTVKEIIYPVAFTAEFPTSVMGIPQIQATNYQLIELNTEVLKQSLTGITYREGTVDGFIGKMLFPHTDGTFKEYTIKRNKTLHPKLNEQFPEIITLDCYATDGSGAFGKWDITPKGLHAMIFVPGESTIFIDPIIDGNNSLHIIYRKKDFTTSKLRACDVVEPLKQLNSTGPSVKSMFGTCDLRTYRLAVAATGEYTTFHGGTVALAQAAQATTMNRVNGVYEKDIAITMVIVPTNSSIIYTNAATDPYTNGTPGTMINQNQTTCDNLIGSANYDVGHVFGTNSGGLAGLGVVCTGSQKARGVTGSGAPIGDPFDIDYVAHELGHQFGGNHTQNNNCNSVSAARREPGSASTIMGYAGICAPNVQNNSDDYFHGYNLGEISAEILSTGHQCEVITALNNTPPTISGTNGNISVPKSTPFVLTATATDPDGDVLSYLWEQMDNEASTQPPVATATGGPNFRSFDPTTSPSRYFPSLASLASNGPFTWEVLPSVARTMDFRLTVRDNHAIGSCNDFTDVTVSTVAAAGPFVVSYPTATGITWGSGSTQTVTWDVANTTASPINCANVSIRLSLDGGVSYPIILVASTPNDGSQVVNVPNASSTTARIMVLSSAETFFDISNNNFAITCTNPVIPTFSPAATVCQGSGTDPLPLTSTNSISGTWSPAFSAATTGTTNYTFTPTAGLCASTATLAITVTAATTPTFDAISPVCQNSTPPVLPATSTNGITGTWSPTVSTGTIGTTNYTFTPNASTCASPTTLSVTVSTPAIPTFGPIGPYCQGQSTSALPTSSTNGITGTWSQQVNTSTVGFSNYTFTPASGTCAVSNSISIQVIPPLSNQVTVNGMLLTAQQSGANYQWLDCNAGNSPIAGATSQFYQPPVISGSYAVTVTSGSCSVTSTCFAVDQSGIGELTADLFHVFPNPFDHSVTITWEGITPEEFTVVDAMGKVIAKGTPEIGSNQYILLAEWSAGVYVMYIKSSDTLITKKLIKQ